MVWGRGGAPGQTRAASQAAAIVAKGDAIRALKAAKASKDEVMAAVNDLKAVAESL